MRNLISALLSLPMCLLTMIGGVEKHEPVDIITQTEEIILETTNPGIEEIIVGTMRPDIEEITKPPVVEEITKPPVVEVEPPEEPEKQDEKPVSLGTFRLTAYCGCRKCCGKYADNRPVDENGNVIVTGSTGVQLEEGVSIAVDPGVIPYRSQVVINGHTYTAHDTGGAIKGNRIDVYFEKHEDALNFGVQYAEVFTYV